MNTPDSAALFSPLCWQGGVDIVLLTHATEFDKSSNTGVLVQQFCQHHPLLSLSRLLWSRVSPDSALLRSLGNNSSFLVYPDPTATLLDVDFWQSYWQLQPRPAPVSDKAGQRLQLILLDATWQLAKKMYNQSPYLQQLPAISLSSGRPSGYVLRRNQPANGWCTAETVVLLLTALGFTPQADALHQMFCRFNQRK